MSGKKVFVALAATIALGGAASAAGSEHNGPRSGGYVVPGSLVGVNPALHPEIFGNPAVARSYGFVQGPNGTWHVESPHR